MIEREKEENRGIVSGGNRSNREMQPLNMNMSLISEIKMEDEAFEE
jgi:hypothetical protein